MPDSDLDYVDLVYRLGLTVADGSDAGDNPDILRVVAGFARVTPLRTISKNTGAVVPQTLLGAAYEFPFNGDGYITQGSLTRTYNGVTVPAVRVVDLGSDKMFDPIARDVNAYRLSLHEIVVEMENGTRVTVRNVPTFEFHPTPDGTPAGSGLNDLTLLQPETGEQGEPILVGPRGDDGRGIEALSVEGGDLVYTLDDGTVDSAGELPVGPGGSDEGVADYASTEGTETRKALTWGAQIPRTLGRFRTNRPVKVAIIGDSKHDPGAPGNAGGAAMVKALALVDAWSDSAVTVTNVAESGHTMARQFLQGNVGVAVAAAPDLLVFEIGTNDTNSDENGTYAAGYPMAASLAAVERAVAYARDLNDACEVMFILTTPYTGSLTSTSNQKLVEYNRGLQSLAASVGAEIVDGYGWFAEYGADRTPLMIDSTHRNPAGNDYLAQRIAAHFPQVSPPVPFQAVAPRPVKGRYDISRVDKTSGQLGYLTLAAPATSGSNTFSVAGTWTTDGSFDVTSEVGASMTLSGTRVRELLVNVSLEAVYSPVVDVYLDDVLQVANLDLNAQSGKNTVNYWIAFVTGLDGGAHALRLVLKSGTLRVSSTVIVTAPAGVGTFVPESRIVVLGSGAASNALPTDGTYGAAVIDAVLTKPTGWGTFDAILTGYVVLRVNGETTTKRQINVRIRHASTSQASLLRDFAPVVAGDTFSDILPLQSRMVGATANTQVRLDGRVLSTDKTQCFITGWELSAVLVRTA